MWSFLSSSGVDVAQELRRSLSTHCVQIKQSNEVLAEEEDKTEVIVVGIKTQEQPE
jgi:hypothetical protein